MNLGTLKIWSKAGPVDLPMNTNIFETIQENMGASLQNLIFIPENLKSRNVSKLFKRIDTIFVNMFSFFLGTLSTYVLYKFVKMRIEK